MTGVCVYVCTDTFELNNDADAPIRHARETYWLSLTRYAFSD